MAQLDQARESNLKEIRDQLKAASQNEFKQQIELILDIIVESQNNGTEHLDALIAEMILVKPKQMQQYLLDKRLAIRIIVANGFQQKDKLFKFNPWAKEAERQSQYNAWLGLEK